MVHATRRLSWFAFFALLAVVVGLVVLSRPVAAQSRPPTLKDPRIWCSLQADLPVNWTHYYRGSLGLSIVKAAAGTPDTEVEAVHAFIFDNGVVLAIIDAKTGAVCVVTPMLSLEEYAGARRAVLTQSDL